ncbi:RNA polymerase sigma factor [Listeria ivanovii]|uniref:Sigma-70 family RNA polymerase sigma factor n=2 Tax=Listeria ivanovii TaxID=1638 RepID=A0ABS1G8K9_LISIV|nr:RNA polymerase sigma factor [Listeria ivanovii]AIS58834.1 RNA polymerase sigma70 [Listeria ivanovii subsp. londoniensis]AIS61639.1 RNA polymerase sigma70 [Listeria ivanovii subsp. londoniensis]MBK1963214.1 sigma-70 family RNA polymerase sigma factor [Listeria ivanovii subsp. londoniensis]MBK1965930.1 sigma-70 family RNA polymerase sigma factor [Listeria ivanovii subsp. londoniensis]MBK1984375.1 sigma-70 family RNA polymerase sigma factor [Listeria ivanovii subsp. londoniensis]
MNEDMQDYFVHCITENKADFYRLAFSYVKSEADALDIIQDSIQKALISLHTVKNKDSLKSWFYKIVVRTSIDSLRKKKKVIVMNQDKLFHLNGLVEDKYENIDLKIQLEKLPIKYKTVIILRYFEDLSLEEISYIINRNLSTTKTRLYKAIKLLRQNLKEGELNKHE